MSIDKNKGPFTITTSRVVHGCINCPNKERLGDYEYCSAFEFPGKELHTKYSHYDGNIPDFCPRPTKTGQDRLKL